MTNRKAKITDGFLLFQERRHNNKNNIRCTVQKTAFSFAPDRQCAMCTPQNISQRRSSKYLSRVQFRFSFSLLLSLAFSRFFSCLSVCCLVSLSLSRGERTRGRTPFDCEELRKTTAVTHRPSLLDHHILCPFFRPAALLRSI